MTEIYNTNEVANNVRGVARSEAAVVGPLLRQYGTDRWAVMVGSSKDGAKGPEFFHDCVDLGIIADENRDALLEALLRHARNVQTFRSADERMHAEALEVRRQLIRALATRFDQVHVVEDQLEMARLCERLWPGDEIAEMCAEIEAELGGAR